MRKWDRPAVGYRGVSFSVVCCLAALIVAGHVDAQLVSFLAPEQRFPAGDSPNTVAAADLNGDAIPDLVTSNLRSDDVPGLGTHGGRDDGEHTDPLQLRERP